MLVSYVEKKTANPKQVPIESTGQMKYCEGTMQVGMKDLPAPLRERLAKTCKATSASDGSAASASNSQGPGEPSDVAVVPEKQANKKLKKMK